MRKDYVRKASLGISSDKSGRSDLKYCVETALRRNAILITDVQHGQGEAERACGTIYLKSLITEAAKIPLYLLNTGHNAKK